MPKSAIDFIYKKCKIKLMKIKNKVVKFMKTKKLIVGSLLFVAIIFCFMLTSKVEATSGLGYLKITRERNATETYMPIREGVKEGPYDVTYRHQLYSEEQNTRNVWKIVTSDEKGNIPQKQEIKDLYCLRAGLGFTNNEGSADNSDPVLYDLAYSIDEDGYKLIQKILYKTTDGEETDNTETLDNAKITIFKEEELDNLNAVLWILDNMLLEDASEEEVKAYLEEYAAYDFKTDDPHPLTVLSRADIEAIQQLAIWYFTNADEEDYHNTNEGAKAEPKLATLYAYLQSDGVKDAGFYNTYNKAGERDYLTYSDMFVRPDENADLQDYGGKRQKAAEQLYYALIVNANKASENVKKEYNAYLVKKAEAEAAGTVLDAKEIKSKLYTPNREITVYLASGENGLEAAIQQPVVQVKEKEADIALRKFITKVENENSTIDLSSNKATTREPSVDTSDFNRIVNGKLQKTAIYNHSKEAVPVKKGDFVTYTIRLYNEGEVPAYIKQVTDYLPEYLSLDITDEEREAYWQMRTADEPKVLISTEFCKIEGAGGLLNYDEIEDKILANVEIPAAKRNPDAKSEEESWILSYVDIKVRCKVSEYIPMELAQTNIAEVTIMKDKSGADLKDRDSQTGNVVIPQNENNSEEDSYRPNYTGGDNKKELYYNGKNVIIDNEGNKYYPGQQDDDDFDKVIVKKPTVDMALRKFIKTVENEDGITDLSTNEETTREPNPDLSGIDALGTAIYNHTKEPVPVKAGNIVTYTIRLYNEGEVAGYVTEVKDYTSKYLKYVPSEDEKSGNWWTETEGTNYNTLTITENCKVVGVGGKILETEIGKALGDVLIPAYDKTAEEGKQLSYVDIRVSCEVKDTTIKTKITNIAEITKEAIEDITLDEEGNEVINKIEIEKDKDSKPGNVEVPPTEKYPSLPNYEGNGKLGENYIKGQEDDDDFEKLLIEPYFDLALRKFITAVGNTSVNNRIPEVNYEDGVFTYTHSKEPVSVKTGDIVTYTIRIFNEGQADGYANEITDDMPEGLEFVVDNKTNIEYRWKMLDENQKETTDVKKAKYIITDYLSEEQEKETGRDNKINAFNLDEKLSKTNPDYKDVKVAFKVTYVPTTVEETKRTIVNVAQISADSDDDIDSKPNRDEVYKKDGNNEDDIDYDNVIVKYFDLALLKWVSQTKVTLNGETVITDTGHTVENARNEAPVKLEIKESDINKVVIKYVYTILVTNEGELEGYATEIKDHIPAGLKFIEEDNTEYGWKDAGNGMITTDKLKDTLLKPNQSAELKIVLTWINGKDNFGEKVNLAEISKDKNDGDVPDIDSTPDNLEPNRPYEDDEDDAPVILALQTGTAHVYFGLIGIILITFASGIGLIKKYVL